MGKSSDFFALPEGAEYPQGDRLLRYTRRINDLELRACFILSHYDNEIALILDVMTKLPAEDYEAHCRLLNSYVSNFGVSCDVPISYSSPNILDDYRELRALRPIICRLRNEYDKLLDSILGVK